jgi:hypothetical protein
VKTAHPRAPSPTRGEGEKKKVKERQVQRKNIEAVEEKQENL